MINNLLLSRLKSHDGMRIVNSLHNVDSNIPEFIRKHSIFIDAAPNIFTELRYNRDYIFTTTFTVKENEDERPNFYALHLITDRNILNIEGILKHLVLQFSRLNVKEYDLAAIASAFEQKKSNFSMNGLSFKIDWDNLSIGGTDEIW